MFGRVLLAAILAGLAAGLVMGVIQHVRLTPLILEAEKYEHVEHGHGATDAEGRPHVESHGHGDQVWSPTDGFERTAFTTLTAMVTGAGFALLLAGISLLARIPITPGNGLIWGLCGFLVVSFSPAIGLPAELPGMPAAGLVVRQGWWIGTIACTGLAIWLVVTQTTWMAHVGAAVLVLVPHIFGAPRPPADETTVPAGLAAEFATSSLGANFVFWILIGLFLALALAKFESDAKA
jgi:cobalt transporter subunit CbtA